MLFPTIERIAKTPNGYVATPLLCWLRYALYVPFYIGLNLMPTKVLTMLSRLILQRLKIENEITSRHVMNSLNMNCVGEPIIKGLFFTLCVSVRVCISVCVGGHWVVRARGRNRWEQTEVDPNTPHPSATCSFLREAPSQTSGNPDVVSPPRTSQGSETQAR